MTVSALGRVVDRVPVRVRKKVAAVLPTRARGALRQVLRGDPGTYESERAFWAWHFESPNAQGDFDTTNMQNVFPQVLLPIINELHGSDPVRVLELGPGPVSLLAWGVTEGLITVTAVDPLADSYAAMLAEHGYTYPIEPINGTGEELFNVVSEGSFDIAYSSNALDHVTSPQLCVKNLVSAVREGGYICVEGQVREGTATNWTGLHQHDLTTSDGDLLHQNRAGVETNLTADLGLDCVFEEVRPLEGRGLTSHGHHHDGIESPEDSEAREWYALIFRRSTAPTEDAGS